MGKGETMMLRHSVASMSKGLRNELGIAKQS